MSGPHPPDDEITGRAYDARLVRRLVPDLRVQAPLITASLALMLAGTAVSLAQPYLLKRLIDDHLVPGRAAGMAGLILLYAATMAVALAARYAQTYTMEQTGQNIILALRHRVFAHLQRLDAAFFDRYPVGRLMTRVTTDVESLADLFSSGVVTLLGDSLKLVAIIAILLWLDWRLFLLTFTTAPLLFLLSVAFRGRIRAGYREVRRRIARINAYLQESVSGMLLVQLYRRERVSREEFDTINREHREAEVGTVVFESVFSAVVELVGTLAVAVIVWYGGGRILGGALTFGTLAAFIEYTGRFFGPIRDLSGFYAVLQGAMASLERIFALLDERPAIAGPAAAAGPGAPPAGPVSRALGRIAFEEVRFAYRPGEEVLHGVTFAVEPGERVAIVGATGSGKTTLVRLLIRLYDPTGGRVRLDGRDLRELPLPWLRRQIGVVLQDHFLVTGTIAGNIAFGDATLPPARLEEAARLSRADDFIRRLPGGYDEPVRERGGNLSVGQKQLLSFARVLARDPAILVLDEATSSVDTETESRIQEALRELLRGRTSIVIAHRLSTIAGADRILVLHHGRLVEEGDHRSLLRRGGIYERLYRLQFAMRTADGPAPPRAGAS
ncbi:MAG: ABC transporter ATP-binding protein [Candidatus Polarisedimenticolia bacterium]